MVLTFAACSNNEEEAPDGMKNVAGDHDAYYLYVPQSWVESNGLVGAYYSAADTSNVTVTAYSGSEYASSAEYWDGFKKDILTVSTEFAVVSENEAKVIDGRNAVEHVYTLTVNGVKYKVQQDLVAYSNIMYVITFTSTEDRFDAHAEDVKKIIDEFKFK